MFLTLSDLCRFWQKVNQAGPDECWTWDGTYCTSKYGQFFLNGKLEMAHRVSYFVATAIDPMTFDVLHSCDTPSCVNPNHLSLGTHTENMHQSAERRRGPQKMNWELIFEIREKYAQGYTQKDLVEEYRVNKSTISSIVNNKSWVE